MFKKLFVLLAIVMMACTAQAADSYPSKTINLIVPFTAGGISDIQARLVEKYWTKYSKVRLNFIYKPGAAGSIGFGIIARSPADGYTFGCLNAPHIIIQPLTGNVPFNIDSFDYLAQCMEDVPCILVRKDSKYNTLEDLFEDARQNPNKVKVSMTGPLSGQHVTFTELTSKYDVPLAPIFYKGGANQIAAVLGGETNATLTAWSEGGRQQKGELKILAFATPERDATFTGVPTMKELGYDVSAGTTRRGFVTPKGVPAERLQYLRDVLAKIHADPAYKAEAKAANVPDFYLTGEDFEAVIRAEGDVIRSFYKEMKK